MKKPLYKNFLLILGIIALFSILPLISKSVLTLFVLLIAIKFARYWFPLIAKILIFCWKKAETKTTGAKKSQPTIYYRKHGD